MKRYKVIGFCALFVSAFFLTSLSGFGQGSILELLPGSERMSGDEKIGAIFLAGNVVFTYQGNTMYCDSAVYFHKKNLVRAYKNVHLNKSGDLNLFCDSLWYDANTKMALLWGNVRARDQEYKLTTNALEYDAKAGRATYRSNGQVESIDGQEKLTSRIGYFYPEKKDFFFKGDVKFSGPTMNLTTDTLQYSYLKRKVSFFGPTEIFTDSSVITCERGWYRTDNEESELIKNATITKENQFISGDTLFYQPQKELAIGRGNVMIKDTLEKLELRGDYLYKNDLTNRTFVTGHALAIKADQKDSLFIHADTLSSANDSLKKPSTIFAYNNVRIFQNKLQGICDSLILIKSQNQLQLYKQPIIWTEKGELKGDTIFVFLNDSLIERAEIFQASSALFQVDTSGLYNQIAGRKMVAHLTNNEVSLVTVKGNAQTIFFPEQEEKTDTTLIVKRTGMNRLYASELIVYMDSGEVSRITYFDQPDGRFYPMDQLNKEEQFVQNFKWNPILRPKSWQEMILD